jgi:hydroxymethylglutaryl-CoA synthase
MSEQRRGIIGYGAYVPRHRLSHAELGAVGGGGSRVVASYDEDSTTMGVEAARRALPPSERPGSIHFATTTPAYLDKTNAAAIHAALDLGHEGFAVDVAGAVRSSVAAARAAAGDGGTAVLSDLWTGRPGSADEREGADAAAAIRFGSGSEVIAEIMGEASATAELLDRWRAPGEVAGHRWEERFGLEAYRPLVRDTVRRALATSHVEQPDHVVVSSAHARTARSARKELAGRVPDEPLPLGYAGAADPGVRLAAVLDRAQPGETVLLVIAADGCDAIVLRATEGIDRRRSSTPVIAQLDGGQTVGYTTYLTWRGLLEREFPRRPEPERPAAPPAARSESWKFAFVGSRCRACGVVHLPPRRVCGRCATVDRMERAPLAGSTGTVSTYTVDRLAYSPSPPVIDAVVDFDGGGRCALEVADAAPEHVTIGTRVALTFRRLYTVGGVHNYFWKVRPLDG